MDLSKIIVKNDLFDDKFITDVLLLKNTVLKNSDSYNMVANRYFIESDVMANFIQNIVQVKKVFPNMRIIEYETGGYISPHTDGKSVHEQLISNYTFIIYLTDPDYLCSDSTGATEFLDDKNNIVQTVIPKKGRILMFPHNYLHQGQCVEKSKIILRGDLII